MKIQPCILIITSLLLSCSPPETELLDVHGAGAQRSDPKTGDPTAYPDGHGPQGDLVYVYNYARCVRTAGQAQDYAVVDTGQELCYGAGFDGVIPCPADNTSFAGQDGQIQGNAPTYVDNGDGTVADQVTGLVWEKAFHRVAWSDAEADAAATRTGNHDDWRVPTIKELYSLMRFDGMTGSAGPETTSAPSDAVPYLDTVAFDFEYPSTGRYIDAQYISSTSYVSTTMHDDPTFFGVNFADGRIKGYPKSGGMNSSTFNARWVRGNASYGSNILAANNDGTIGDLATGLMWLQNDSGHASFADSVSDSARQSGALDWREALAFCDGLVFSGKDDWRLPNAKELHSVVDYTRSPDTTDSAAMNSLFSGTSIIDAGGDKDYPYYWSSTTHLDGPVPGEWAVYFSFGEAEGYMGLPPSPELASEP